MSDDSAIAQQYAKKMQIIEESILDLLEEEEPQQKDYDKINEIINSTKTEFKQQDLRQILYLLINIAENHYKTPGFFDRIFTLINPLLQDLKDLDLFNVFKDHKLLLLYLFQNEIIKPTKQIKDIIYDNRQYEEDQYDYYFFPEFRHFFEKKGYYSTYHEKRKQFYDSVENFEEKRKSGENDGYICQLIRNDSIEEFIIYITKNSINYSSEIEKSVFETNPLLLTKKPSLIEYAAFYGSIQIFQYLLFNKAELTPDLCMYAIHGRNAKIIHLLEENQIKFDSLEYLNESILCHHNEISNYIKNQINDDDSINKQIFCSCLQFHNFIELFELVDKIGFNSFDKLITLKLFIKYDYIIFTKFLLNDSIIKNDKYYENVPELVQMVIDNGNVELFDLFINDFDVNKKIFNYENETVLHAAVKCGKYGIVKYLLNKRLDINVNELVYGGGGEGIGGYGHGRGEKNSLHIAIQNEDVRIVELLLNKFQIDVNAKFIREVVNNGGINSDIKELTPLYMAVKAQNYDIVHDLLSHYDIDVNARSLDVFYYNYHSSYENRIMDEDDFDFFMELNYRRDEVEYDEEEETDDNIYVESYKRDPEITRMYRGGGVKTPLFAAIELNDIKMVEILLSHPEIDVNARSICYSPYKKSLLVPLYEAVDLDYFEIKELLMSTGKIDLQKVSSFYEEKEKKNLGDKRFFVLQYEKLPTEKS